MKTNQTQTLNRTAAVAIAFTLAITAGACAGTQKQQQDPQPNVNSHWQNLVPASRANHNPLLDPSFYNSNHQIPS